MEGGWSNAQRIQPASPEVSTSSRSLQTGLDESEGIVEAWLILEYCDLGTLMVRLRTGTHSTRFCHAPTL